MIDQGNQPRKPPDHAAPQTLVRKGLLLLVVGIALVLAVLIGRGFEPPNLGQSLRSSETIVTAVRRLARLETASMRLQKVVDLQDEQSRFWGTLKVNDGILLIASANVIAGIDLSDLGDEAVSLDETHRSVLLTLPRAELFSVALDNQETYVYSRTTDVLARHNPHLETQARSSAEQMLRQSALSSDLVQTAETNAEQILRALLQSLGYAQVTIRWQGRSFPE